MPMVLVGAALLLVALAGSVVAVRAWPLWTALRHIHPTTPERLVRAAGDGHLDGRIVAVAGIAGTGPGGPLRSAVNHEPCIWHRHTVHRRHISYRASAGGGTTQRYSRRKRVADVASREPFGLRPVFPRPSSDEPQPARATLGGATIRLSPADGLPESTGSRTVVEVRPDGMRVHRPVAQSLRILPGLVSDPFPDAEVLMAPTSRMYWHREWLLRAGAQLFVLGQVRADGSSVVVSRPAKGPNIVSTRTATSIRRRTALAVIGGLTTAVLAGSAGAAALFVHFV
jgi:hypothetical protein